MGEMKTETIVRSFRVTENVVNKIKEIQEDLGFTQDGAFSELVRVYEMEKCKNSIPNRETEIANFQAKVGELIDSFLYSLQLNQDAESRIRAEFELKLENDAAQIANLRKKVKEIEEQATESNLVAMKETDKRKLAEQSLKDALEKIETIQTTLKDKENINFMLTAKLAEAEKKLDDYPALKETNDTLKEKYERLQQEMNELKRDHELAKARAEMEKEKAVASAELNTERSLLALEKQKNEENQKLRDKIEKLKDELVETKLLAAK